jgi:8-oxo-dGTP pyrophosphatase MutT (NUDIX family)
LSGSSGPDVPEERFFYSDPDAPAVNKPLQPGVAAVIFDDQSRILILKRTLGPYWSLPGGRQDVGESAAECCIRETREETGLETRVERLIGLYTNAGSICAYPDGNIHQSYIALFECSVIGSELRKTEETHAWHWLCRDELEARIFNLLPDNVLCCRDAWSRQEAAFIR